MRRIATTSRVITAAAIRCYTPPAECAKLFETNYSAGPFPVEFVPSDVVGYAQFIYKLAESNKKFDAYMKDFDTLKAAKLPVFWERSTDVTSFADVTKIVSADFVFLLRWMQVEGNLEKLDTVRGFYETLLNAQKKKLVVLVYANQAGSTDSKVQSEAKALVQEAIKTNPLLKGKDAFALDFKFVVDASVPGKGFYAEFGGVTLSTIQQIRSDDVSTSAGEIDYTNVIPIKQVLKTVWDENIETDVLRKYLDQYALIDEEEQKVGV
eukprot:PhF_6_TR30714/c0_g1_i1/m.45195